MMNPVYFVLATIILATASPLHADEEQPGDYDNQCKCVDPHNGIRQIPVLIRDFKDSHPDFEAGIVSEDYGIVEKDLGLDGLPIYAGKTLTTNGKENFDQWYRNAPGVNTSISKTLAMTEITPGFYRYSNAEFFPIDHEGFGNQGRIHNYHFTLETHLKFFYVKGGHFTFNGDDDLWIFINGKLAIDIGGVHEAISKTVYLDDVADELGIKPGNTYSFDLFFAERQFVKSSFRFETTFELQCL